MKNEIEATFLSVDKEFIRKILKEKKFDLKIPEYMMRRKTFDFPNVTSGTSKWGRVRQEFDKITMTIKEIKGSGISDTYEVELIVNNFDIATEFFGACNIVERAFQENMREVWTRDGVEVTIDTWPGLNPFVEIEGDSEDLVKKISSELGFDFTKAVFGSIDLVYEKEMGIPAKIIVALPEITFSKPPQNK